MYSASASAERALPGIEIRQRRPVFWTVCVELERGDKLTRSLIKALPISRRLAIFWDGCEKTGSPNADAENRIGQKWRNQWPDLRRRHSRKHVHRSDPDRRVGIGQAAARQIRISR